MKTLRARLSAACWAIALVVCMLYYAFFSKGDYAFYGDALGYYLYLPSTFIYHNHTSIEKLPDDAGVSGFIREYMAQIGQTEPTPKGHYLNQYTYGVALLELPFFLAAHAWEILSGGKANGYSESYTNAVEYSSYFYAALGLLLTYRLLRRRFSPGIAGITSALLLIGTNLFWFTMQQQGMAHVPLFFLFALLLHFTIRIHEGGRLLHFAGLGLVAGLITVIRPVGILCLLIPLCYTTERPFIRSRLSFISRHRKGILLAACCFILPILPQLLYWKWLTGSFLYYSYGPKQGFNFLRPHIPGGLFGASNGWLTYTPLMLFAVAGLFSKRLGPLRTGLLIFLPLYIWVIYSWYVPNYINGLGSRPMVDVYAWLAFPFAVSLEWISRRGPVVKCLAAGLIILFTAVNLNYSVQQRMRVLWAEESKHIYNLNMLFRYKLDYDDLVVWDLAVRQPDPANLEKVHTSRLSLQDSALSEHVVADSIDDGRKVYRIAAHDETPKLALTLPYDSLEGKGIRWLRFSGRFLLTERVYSIYDNTNLVLQVKRGPDLLAWYGLRLNNKIGLPEGRGKPEPEIGIFNFREGSWGRVSAFVPLPSDIRRGDLIRLDIWNSAKRPLFVSELMVEGFR